MWLQILITAMIADVISGCNLHCQHLSLMPSLWSYEGKDVPVIAISCQVMESDHCSIDIITGLNLTDYIDYSNKYTSLDLHFNCSDQHVSLGIQNCSISWDALSYIGSKVYLMQTQISFSNTYADQLRQTSSSADRNLSGLEKVIQLKFEFLDFIGKVDLSELMPRNQTVWPNVAGLEFLCRNNTVVPFAGCPDGDLTYDTTYLRTAFPHLQSLFLSDVNPVNSSESLNFPWDTGGRTLPLNMRRSQYQENQYMIHARQHASTDQFRRLLILRHMNPTDAMNICPGAEKRLEIFAVNFVVVTSLPSKCLPSQLTLGDFQGSNLYQFEPDIFRNQSSLEAIHLEANKIETLTVGTFDDLINLSLLSLSYNPIKHLPRGIFSKLVSLRTLLMHSCQIITIDRGALPIFSPNLTFVDLRWNPSLKAFPTDCLHLPALSKCDLSYCNVTLDNLSEIVESFNPIKSHMFDPSSYYGLPAPLLNEGTAHETDQTEINLTNQNGSITTIPFNSSWTEEMKLRLASFLSVSLINLQRNILRCDCQMYQLRQWIAAQGPQIAMQKARYLHVLSVSLSNFDTWHCKAHRIVGGETGPFCYLKEDLFLCRNESMVCPEDCACYVRQVDGSYAVDCYKSDGITDFPMNIQTPPKEDQELIVSLAHNQIRELPNIHLPGYQWLERVTTLDLEDNSITTRDTAAIDLEAFLNKLKRIKVLKLSSNNIIHLPRNIQLLNLTLLTLAGNNLVCDCTTTWLKDWLISKTSVIQSAKFIGCKCDGTQCKRSPRSQSIVELEKTDYICEKTPLPWQFAVGFLIAFFILVAMILAVSYRHADEIKILLFEKFNFHPFDSLTDEPKDHDAFLLYTEEDRVWALETLCAYLNRKGYKVTDKDHFDPGGYTINQLDTALESTHRVIAVLSQAFLQDEDCMNDFHRALTYERNNGRYILIVTLERLSLLDEEEHRQIRNYQNTNFYIPVRDSHFWSRLLYWMPKLQLPKSTANLPYDDTQPEETATDRDPIIY